METITIPSPSAFLRKSPVNDTRSTSHGPLNEGKKNSHKRPLASSSLYSLKDGVQDGGITKPKQSKSRNGCITCKGKRLKCDESKPTCQQCGKRNVPCGGYSKAFKWRSFEEANFTGKSGPRPRKVSPPPPPPPPPAPVPAPSGLRMAAQIRPQSSPVHDSRSEITPRPGAEYEYNRLLPSPNTFSDLYQMRAHSNRAPAQASPHLPIYNAYNQEKHLQNEYQHQPFVDLYPSHSLSDRQATSESLSHPKPIAPPRQAPSFATGSPTLRDLLLPGTDMNSPPPPMELRPPQSPLPYIPSGYTPPTDVDTAADDDDDDEEGEEEEEEEEAEEEEEEEEGKEGGEGDDDDVEEIVRRDDPAARMDYRSRAPNNWSWRRQSVSPSPSDSSASSTSSSMDLWAQPRLPSNSQEMLVLQFDRHTCGILSVKDGPNENPWRTVIWPLAQDSKHLYHAIASLTAFHSSKTSPKLRVDGISHMDKSIKKLATSLNKIKLNERLSGNEIEAALATTLVLAFSESWDQHVSTGIKHLKGAKFFVNQAVVKHQHLLQQGKNTTQQYNQLKFLCNSFIYMDVIARLTSLEEDDFGDLDNVLATFNEPSDNMPEIDPLMGAASTLFPLIGRVAAIITRVRKSSTNSFTLISDAIEIKRRIEQWQPPAPVSFEIPEDPTSEVQHSIQTAEAYRWATLLYLHQAVPEIPSDPASVLADRVLRYLATVPLSSRAIIIQIFPLLAASCEAVSEEDRSWVCHRWVAMSARMSIGNVDKCFEVTKEAWDRRDQFEAEKAKRISQRQTARGIATSGLFSPISARGSKRKASDEDVSPHDAFFNSSAISDPSSFPSVPSAKRRAMTDHQGLQRAVRIDEHDDGPSIQTDPYQPASMHARHTPLHSPVALQSPTRTKSNDIPLENMEAEYTVRGQLHWIGVMSDHDWEVLLG